MKTCSACQRCYDDAYIICEQDNHDLIDARLGSPEMIANYRLDFLLRRDPLSETYQASHASSNETFVVKFISLRLANGTQNLRESFLSESKTAASINHQNVIRVYQSGVLDGDEFYTVTEAVNGQTLREYEAEKGVLSEVEAVLIARQIADALASIHQAGVVHRLLNPANIIVTFDEKNQILFKVQNIDFAGLMQQAITSDEALVNFGEEWLVEFFKYLSPEQCARQSIDARSDIYSLGVVLFELLNGKLPFADSTVKTLIDKQINQEPPSLETRRFDIKALLTHTVMHSLKKNPSMRLQKASQFASQLRYIEQLAAYSHPPLEKLSQTASVKQTDSNALAAEHRNETTVGATPSELFIAEESQQNQFLEESVNGTYDRVSVSAVPESFSSEKSTEQIIADDIKFLSDEEDILLNPTHTVSPLPRPKSASAPQTEVTAFSDRETSAFELDAEEDYATFESKPRVSFARDANRISSHTKRPNSIPNSDAARRIPRNFSSPHSRLAGAGLGAVLAIVLCGLLFFIWQSQPETPETAGVTTAPVSKQKKSAPTIKQEEVATDSNTTATDTNFPLSVPETLQNTTFEGDQKNLQDQGNSANKELVAQPGVKEPIVEATQALAATEVAPPVEKAEEKREEGQEVKSAEKTGEEINNENNGTSLSPMQRKEAAKVDESALARPRIITARNINDLKPANEPENAEKSKTSTGQCAMQVNERRLSVFRNGGMADLLVMFENAADAEKLSVTTDSPTHISIALQPGAEKNINRRVFQIASISEFTKTFTVFVKSPCGREEVKIRVK